VSDFGSISPLFCGPATTCYFICFIEVNTKLEQSQMAQEQDATALNQARDA
jgi:hypothetical protein